MYSNVFVKLQLHSHGMVTIITGVGVIQRLFQLESVVKTDPNLMHGRRYMAQHIINSGVDEVAIQHTLCPGTADTKPRPPELCWVEGNTYSVNSSLAWVLSAVLVPVHSTSGNCTSGRENRELG